jgi:hypothetical protein
MKDKIILIAHFDAAGRLTADWRRLIARLKAEDFAELVLISTGIDASAHRESLQGVRVIERENIGYDFTPGGRPSSSRPSRRTAKRF